MEILSMILNFVLSSGLIATGFTIRSLRAKAKAESKNAIYDSQRKEVDLVNDLQSSNDLLSSKLNELLKEIVTVKLQNSKLELAVGNLTLENEQLRHEIAELSRKITHAE